MKKTRFFEIFFFLTFILTDFDIFQKKKRLKNDFFAKKEPDF